ncbi:transporter substrate-binding domain-containing protein [Pseudooceanicola algae]|uniref:Glutamine-binding periplasmic protein n=1 Tax=Pseudooceanicola algae TaxID=1537215 RepID=A0A418SG98_9RHOB|nr:transporter substrate-binding domain-containing protein [Pseudooceanicola algae]QPM91665.1 Glutamine-binding periplasmic protein [Pseudooceanicola algae]
MNKTLLGLLAAAGLGLTATAASADVLSDIMDAGKITVATEMHYAPFDILEDGKYVGIDADIFAIMSEKMGVEVEYLDLPWQSILPGLEAGKFDFVIAPVTMTAERMERYNFSLPIGNATVALAKKAGDDSIMTPEDIAGKAAGSQKGSAQLAQLQAFSDGLETPADVREYGNIDEALADLAAGRLSGVANSLPLMGYAAVQRPGVFELVLPPFGDPKYFGWVAAGGDETTTLIAKVNEILLEMHEDGSLDAINEKWLGAAPELPTTMPEVQ